MTPRAKRGALPLEVAIVDDEPSVRTGLSRLCEALGMHPTAYASGPEFIAALGRPGAEPDCLLLDARMPEMTGLEVQEHLVRSGARFPTIVITADDAPESEQRYRAAGIAAYLQKPVGCDALVAALQEAARSRKPPPD